MKKDLFNILTLSEVEAESVYKDHGSRDTGNDFFVSQISGGSVTFPGTHIVG